MSEVKIAGAHLSLLKTTLHLMKFATDIEHQTIRDDFLKWCAGNPDASANDAVEKLYVITYERTA